ncbi:uncharacterized protein LOC141620178 [Silene latifolia]|uniref:uncharacterized protein LOC141620178 n=1 Tax=Silene latifolia TaxID=37657 RepID=UPI003D7852C9
MVYAFNDTIARKDFWSDVSTYAANITGPLLLCGDFNCVLTPTERLGGQTTIEEIEDFQACVDHCALIDSPATGSFYTWNNKQDPSTRVYSRLDRVLVNQEGLQARTVAYANFFNEGYFDHSPLTGYQNVSSSHKIEEFKATFEKFEQAFEREALKTYRDLQTASDSFLLQKSKATWVNQGDNNTKYFHSVLKNRHVQSKIFRITNIEGHTHTDGDKIQQAFLSYYHQLLGTTATTTPVGVPVVQLGKAPGPDGFSSAFFKDSWSIIGDEVCFVVLDFFANGKLLQQVNHTFITLLPKVDLSQNVTQYRPIACCNVIYKVISKILASRLSKILPDIISPNQGGCLMKVDLKKAYDSVNWSFLEQILDALHFPPPFIQLVMTCVRTASYSLVLNGMNFGYFKGGQSDIHSIMILLRAFATFSIATGLQMNSVKSNIYFNGVHHSVKADVIEVSGFVEGCAQKDSSTEYLRSPPVSWENLSVPKCEGGLGVRNIYYWNAATAAYYMVWIQRNKVLVDGALAHPDRVVPDIISMMKIRCMSWLQNEKAAAARKFTIFRDLLIKPKINVREEAFTGGGGDAEEPTVVPPAEEDVTSVAPGTQTAASEIVEHIDLE